MRTAIDHFSRCSGMRWLLLLFLTLICAGVAGAQTPPPNLFQLDGAAAENTGYPGNPCSYTGGTAECDWWDLINGSGTPGTFTGTGHSFVNTFVSGEASTFAFIGGGSKDPNLISNWACSSTPKPNKDTLTNGYAAAYTAPSGDLVTIFGADRLSTSGDANIGVWFFHEDVHCDPSTGKFTGAHEDGDIFAVSAFVTGGAVPLVSVYEWDHTCAAAVKSPGPGDCAAANLRLKFSASSLCDNGGTLSTQAACSITNSSDILVSWPYPTSGSSTPSTVPAQAFFTGGVNVSNLLGGSTCFTSFLEETRSSQSPNAVLKDFIGGRFNVCSLSNTKSCVGSGTPINGGSEFQYDWTGTVKNTGAQTLTRVSVTDTPPSGCTGGSTTPTLSANTLAPGDSATYPFSCNSSALSVTNSSSATADQISTPVGNSGGTPTCSGEASSTISITKNCVVPSATNSPLSTLSCSSGGCVVMVPWSATVCNTGSSQLTNITVVDYPDPGTDSSTITPNNFTLNAGDCTGSVTTALSCSTSTDCTGGSAGGYTCSGGKCVTPANPTGIYKPTGFDSSSNGYSNGRFLFKDSVSVTSATATLGSNPTPVGGCHNATDLACSGQSCPLCPTGQCVAP